MASLKSIKLRPRQNGRRFPDDIFKCIFLNENTYISIKISLKFVPMGPVNNVTDLVPIMASRRSGDKPLSELMMVSLLTHICATRPQWASYDIVLVYTISAISLVCGSIWMTMGKIHIILSPKTLHETCHTCVHYSWFKPVVCWPHAPPR